LLVTNVKLLCFCCSEDFAKTNKQNVRKTKAMEQRIKNLEDLCELITKEIVDLNKNMIDMNKNLLSEIKCLRELCVQQESNYNETVRALRKIYEQNKQQQSGAYANLPSQPMQTAASAAALAGLLPPNIIPNPNASMQIEQLSQSMMNNVSFQSERTPMHQLMTLQPSSNYSIPSSASAMQMQQQPQQQQQSFQFTPFNQNTQASISSSSLSSLSASQMKVPQQQPPPIATASLAAQQKPASSNVAQFNPLQPPPPINANFNISNSSPQTTFQPSVASHSQQPSFAFGAQQPPANVTSTPQATPAFASGKSAQKSQQQQQPQTAPVISGFLNSTDSKVQQKLPQFQLSPATITAKPLQPTSPLIGATKSTPAANETSAQSKSSTNNTATSIFSSTTQSQSATKPSLFTSPFSLTTQSSYLFGSPTSKSTQPSSVALKAEQQQQLPVLNLFNKASEPTTLTSLLNQDNEADHDGEHGGNPEEYEPQVDFKPVVKLSEVEVKTGEEDEDVLLKLRCKLYRFDSDTKEWKEAGVGEIKLLKHKTKGTIRLLMRRDQVLKLCANHRIMPNLKISELAPKKLSWMASDFSDGDQPVSKVFLAKFRTDEEANQFKSEFEKAVVASNAFPLTPNKSTTQSSATVTPSSAQLSSASANDARTEKYIENQNSKPPLLNFGSSTSNTPSSQSINQVKSPLFTFGAQPSNTPTNQTSTTGPKFDFKGKLNTPNQTAKTNTPNTVVPILNKPISTTKTTTTTPLINANESNMPFQNSPAFSFGSLAAASSGNASTNLFGGQKDSGSPLFKPLGFTGGLMANAQAPKPLFGNVSFPPINRQKGDDEAEEGDDATNQNPEEYEPQVDFKPVVKLSEVEVKTGEEDEESLFKQRCKLFRFDSTTKEWKEKGVGEIKILKHKVNENMFRVLMRRDQVLKLCANHRINADIKLEIVNEKQVRWHTEDFSEGDGKHELFAARFRNENDANQFKSIFEKCQKELISKPAKKSELVNESNSKSDSNNHKKENEEIGKFFFSIQFRLIEI
jgi:E3 SUMO-protein ligase RanBP2